MPCFCLNYFADPNLNLKSKIIWNLKSKISISEKKWATKKKDQGYKKVKQADTGFKLGECDNCNCYANMRRRKSPGTRLQALVNWQTMDRQTFLILIWSSCKPHKNASKAQQITFKGSIAHLLISNLYCDFSNHLTKLPIDLS